MNKSIEKILDKYTTIREGEWDHKNIEDWDICGVVEELQTYIEKEKRKAIEKAVEGFALWRNGRYVLGKCRALISTSEPKQYLSQKEDNRKTYIEEEKKKAYKQGQLDERKYQKEGAEH